MLGRQAEADDCDVGSLARRRRADILDVDLAGDHVVPEPDHDLGQQLQPFALLVGDQDTKMLGLVEGKA